ncbi:unannotated protein [freshwater metagenome]|uniref:Unannotated protein n=1 Tax=freshwater metagenome TaxID=449393 RepID=A0A6J6UNN5_9ZZZZ
MNSGLCFELIPSLRKTRPNSNTRSIPPITSRFRNNSGAIRIMRSWPNALCRVTNGRAVAPPASAANTGVSTSRKPRASRATLIPEIACERRVNTERLCRFSMRSASRCRDRCSIGLGRPRLSPGLTREVESNSNPCTRTDSSPDALETTSPLTPMRSPRWGGSCRGEASLNICNVAPPDSSVANQIPP